MRLDKISRDEVGDMDVKQVVLHRFKTDSTPPDYGRTLLPSSDVPKHCNVGCAYPHDGDCLVYGVSMNFIQKRVDFRFKKYHTDWDAARILQNLPPAECCEINPTTLAQIYDVRLVYDSTTANNERVHVFVQPNSNMPLSVFNNMSNAVNLGDVACSVNPPAVPPTQAASPSFCPPSLDNLLPECVPKSTPRLVEVTYHLCRTTFLRVKRVPSDGYNLLFDVVCAMFDIARYPEDFSGVSRDVVPPYLALLLYRMRFSDLPVGELPRVLALGVAQSDPQWELTAKEANSGVMIVTALDLSRPAFSKQASVHKTDDLKTLQEVLSLPEAEHSMIVDAALRKGPAIVDQILTNARIRHENDKSSPPKANATLSQLLGDGRLAVRGGPVLTMHLELDPPLPAEVEHRAAVIAKLLRDNPKLAELVTAVGLLQLRKAEPNVQKMGSLAPLMIELTPGFELTPSFEKTQVPKSMSIDTLCLAAIPLTQHVTVSTGLQMVRVATSVLDVLSQDMMHCAARHAVWFCGRPFNFRSFVETCGPASHLNVDEWMARAEKQLPAFLKQLSGLSFDPDQSVAAKHRNKQFFVLCSWDELLVQRGASVLKRGSFGSVCQRSDWKFLML